MILLLDVQRKSIVGRWHEEAIDMVSFVAPMATLLICPTRRKRDGMNWEIVSSINAEMGRMIA
jgi:hypothetical protein